MSAWAEFKFWFCHLLALWLGACVFMGLHLGFFICKLGVVMPIGPTFGGLWEDSAEGMWNAWHSVWHSQEQRMLASRMAMKTGFPLEAASPWVWLLRTEMQMRLWLKQAAKAKPREWLPDGLTPGVTVRSVLQMTLFLRCEPSVTEVLGSPGVWGLSTKLSTRGTRQLLPLSPTSVSVIHAYQNALT